jgi:hypothetical protein
LIWELQGLYLIVASSLIMKSIGSQYLSHSQKAYSYEKKQIFNAFHGNYSIPCTSIEP